MYDGPFHKNKRHGVGIVTELRPRREEGSTLWQGSMEDEGWIGDWTEDKPEMRGSPVKKTSLEETVLKAKGWQHLRVSVTRRLLG